MSKFEPMVFRRTASFRLWRSNFCSRVNAVVTFPVFVTFTAPFLRRLAAGLGLVLAGGVGVRELKTGLVSMLVGRVPESVDLSLLEAELAWVLVLSVRWDCNTELWEAAMSSLQIVSKVEILLDTALVAYSRIQRMRDKNIVSIPDSRAEADWTVSSLSDVVEQGEYARG